jgi:hypothetical protein
MVSYNALERRLAALEAAAAPTSPPLLVFVWTKSLADRIEPLLPKDRDIRLVHLTFRDEEAEAKWEAGLQKTNPAEAKRLDRLFRGELDQVW